MMMIIDNITGDEDVNCYENTEDRHHHHHHHHHQQQHQQHNYHYKHNPSLVIKGVGSVQH